MLFLYKIRMHSFSGAAFKIRGCSPPGRLYLCIGGILSTVSTQGFFLVAMVSGCCLDYRSTKEA